MKIKTLLISLLLLLACGSFAQTVGYTYKPLAEEGCSMEYSVSKQDTIYFIITAVKSDRLMFLKESTMLLKTVDGEVIKLQGTVIGNGSESAGIVAGNMVLPITEISSTAQFKVTPAQFELINKGISKVRISTTPIEHEREFNKDKIGKKLYQLFLKQRDKDDSF